MRFLFVLLVAACAVCDAQIATVQKQPDLHVDVPASQVQAMPRLVTGDGVSESVAAKINGSLARFDADVVQVAHDCLAGKSKESDVGFSRTVTVDMRGPAYLSVSAEDSATCDEARPESKDIGLVYDLKTGSPVNWQALLPKGASGENVPSMGKLTLGIVHWPLLERRANRMTKGECADTFSGLGSVSFAVSLSAKERALVFVPQVYPEWVRSSCGVAIMLHADEARRLGVAKVLVDAIAAGRE